MNQNNLPYMVRMNPTWIVYGSLFLLIIPFLIWSNIASINRTSKAPGQIVATAKTQEIQAYDDGVIEKIDVKEGQFVHNGELLVSLQKERAEAAYEDAKAKVAALQATLARLKAEVFGGKPEFPKSVHDYPEFISNQTQLFQRRQQALNDEISALNESLELANQELTLNMPLLETGDIGATEIIRLKAKVSELKGKISNVFEELSTKLQEFADKKITLERTDIYAPIDSIVKNILITTKGARVRPGDVIMELVPFGDQLIVEAKLEPADISFIKKGQKAAVKLDAYDYTIYGIFDGEVIYISPDALKEKTSEGEKSYFTVRIKLDNTELVSKTGKKIEVTPGMTTNVDIITGNRTVFEYIAKPIIKTVSEAFHER